MNARRLPGQQPGHPSSIAHTLTAMGLVFALAACAGGDATTEPSASALPTAAAETTAPASDAPAAPDGDAFLVALEDGCASVNEQILAVEASNEGAVTSEAAVAVLGGIGEAIRGYATAIQAAEVPADHADAVDAYVAALDTSATAFEDGAMQVEAGEASDEDAFMGLYDAAMATTEGVEQVATEEFGFSLASCGTEAATADPNAAQVEVIATDFAFTMPELAAGPVAITMDNQGQEAHEILLVKLDGITLDEALAELEQGADPESLPLELVGETGVHGPGEQGVVNADLSPGDYAFLCFVSGDDGVPHAFRGMADAVAVE